MKPLHFGTSSRLLLGMLHPAEAPARRTGVILCNPLGQEAIRAHRAYRQLALALARARFPGLRFDYFGTGDSAGDPDEGTVEQWIEDIGTAADELKDTAGVTRVSLVGLRLGGTLALLAARARRDVDTVVLWDPVVSGGDYLEELRVTHAEYLDREMSHAGMDARMAAPGEVLGFPVRGALARGIRGVELLRAPAPRVAAKIALVVSRDGFEPLRDHLAATSGAVGWRQVVAPGWNSDEAMNAAVVPSDILQAIVAALT